MNQVEACNLRKNLHTINQRLIFLHLLLQKLQTLIPAHYNLHFN